LKARKEARKAGAARGAKSARADRGAASPKARKTGSPKAAREAVPRKAAQAKSSGAGKGKPSKAAQAKSIEAGKGGSSSASGGGDILTVGMAQMEVHPGEPARNAAAMLEILSAAKASRIDLLVFPEMCLPGYLLGDMWERPAFLRECELWAARIVEATRGLGPAVVFGTVITDWGAKHEDGRPRKYNGFIAAQGGKALIHPGTGKPYGIKTLLPNYREFEEPRHFQDTRKLAQETGRSVDSFLEPVSFALGGRLVRAGIVLCEDGWDDDYPLKPLSILGRKGCDLILNLSSSPFTQGKNPKRHRVFSAHARRLGLPLFYVNAVSLQNNAKTLYTFDGRSTAYGPDGSVVGEMAPFARLVGTVALRWKGRKLFPVIDPDGPTPQVPDGLPPPAPVRIREVHQALRFGAEAYLKSIGARKVVVGVSGGIDSAVAAALYGEFLGPEDLLLVNMPSRYNSATTRNLSAELARNLGCLYAEIGIEDSVALTRAQVDGLTVRSLNGSRSRTLKLGDLALENVQARDRSSRILSALSSAFGGVFTCNANKAEMTVGYSTLYGDLGGYLALIGDLWKSEVYALGRHVNDEVYGREVIPEGIFTVVPSAELSSAQAVDEGKGDPLAYPYHDRLFFAFVQRWNRATPEEVLEWYAEGSLNRNLGVEGLDAQELFPDAAAFIRDLEKWWELYNGMAVAKRVQAPPILAVSSRAFGFDHREALGRPFYSTRYLELRKRLLEGAPAKAKPLPVRKDAGKQSRKP
jgi:NAD+ synthase (glutamine-hydrolysing)